MSKYASKNDTVKIIACYESIPAQLAKDNKKFQYKVVQKDGYELFYWESGNEAELDFLIKKDGNIIPIEAKAGMVHN